MKQKRVSKNYMDSVFVPSEKISWTQKDGSVILDIPNTGFFNKLAQAFFHKPKISHITLDKYGSTLWLLLDGSNSVFDVVNKMKDAFPQEQDRMLDRVITFFHTLQINKYIFVK